MNEPGLKDWTIYLDANNNSLLDAGEVRTTTYANGQYVFLGLSPATYRVREVPPQQVGTLSLLDSYRVFNNGPDVYMPIAEAPLTAKLSQTQYDQFQPNEGNKSRIPPLYVDDGSGIVWFCFEDERTDAAGTMGGGDRDFDDVQIKVTAMLDGSLSLTFTKGIAGYGYSFTDSGGNIVPGYGTIFTGLPVLNLQGFGPWVVTVPNVGAYTVTATSGTLVNGIDFGNYNTLSLTPGQVDLIDASDTGVSLTDNITKFDNSAISSRLQFLVTGTVSGATLDLYADGVLIGSAIASGTSTTVTTTGDVDLADGLRSITARQTEPGKPQSFDSAALPLLIDTTPPTVAVDPLATADRTPALTGTVNDPAGSVSVTVNDQTHQVTNLGTTWLLADGAIATPLSAGTYDVHVTATDVAGNVGSDETADELVVNSTIAGRYTFYNGSILDGGDAAANASDDAAIDLNRTALLAGEEDSPGHCTGFSQGINGVMVDIAGLADSAGLTLDNIGNYFAFAVATPAGEWQAAPASAVQVRQGAGVGGSDRVTILWPTLAIKATWLQVTVLGNSHTGLAGDDVFYFANLPGDFNGDGTVDISDLGILAGYYNKAATVTQGDANGDGTVDISDLGILAGNYNHTLPTRPASLVGLLGSVNGLMSENVSIIAESTSAASDEPIAIVQTATQPSAAMATLLPPAVVQPRLVPSALPSVSAVQPATVIAATASSSPQIAETDLAIDMSSPVAPSLDAVGPETGGLAVDSILDGLEPLTLASLEVMAGT